MYVYMHTYIGTMVKWLTMSQVGGVRDSLELSHLDNSELDRCIYNFQLVFFLKNKNILLMLK
jgi:hypothetical protein